MDTLCNITATKLKDRSARLTEFVLSIFPPNKNISLINKKIEKSEGENQETSLIRVDIFKVIKK